jgi:hypothetical protein
MSRRIVGGIALALAAAAYVVLRLQMNHEFEGAPWAALVDGTAKLPFGHRVLVPLLVRPFVAAGVSIKSAFAVTEWVAVIATVLGTRASLRAWLPERPATLWTGGLAIVLPLAFLLRYKWPIFYPWDTPAVAFTVWGLALAQSRRFIPLLVLSAMAATNRESALLLPAVAAVVHLGDPQRRAEALRWSVGLLLAVLAVRYGVAAIWVDNAGNALSLRVEGMPRILHNLRWLRDPTHVLLVLGAFSGLPLLWPLLARFIPDGLHRLHLVVVLSFGGLMIVANIYEPRAFGEPLVLAYIPVAVGLWRWQQDKPAAPTDGWVQWVDRVGAVAIFVVWSALVVTMV